MAEMTIEGMKKRSRLTERTKFPMSGSCTGPQKTPFPMFAQEAGGFEGYPSMTSYRPLILAATMYQWHNAMKSLNMSQSNPL